MTLVISRLRVLSNWLKTRHSITLGSNGQTVVHLMRSTLLSPDLRRLTLPWAPLVQRWKQSRSDLYPALVEEELEEDFVRGSGPGGQATNKTNNCCVLKHLPTGLVVKCHESRSLVTNRATARLRLQERLDYHWHGPDSIAEREKREGTEKLKKKELKTKERLEKLRQFKEREGLT